jgi:hypothetical protein
VVAIAAGTGHACAARRGGKVVCWGSNYSGELGDGSGGLPGAPTEARSHGFVEVADLSDAVRVAVGTGFSCALRSSGSIECWGDNARGQLGRGTSALRLSPAP